MKRTVTVLSITVKLQRLQIFWICSAVIYKKSVRVLTCQSEDDPVPRSKSHSRRVFFFTLECDIIYFFCQLR